MAFTDPYRQHNYLGEHADNASAEAFITLSDWQAGVPQDGLWYYNTTSNEFVGRMGGAWVPLTGSIAITGNGEIYVDAVDGSDATGDGSVGKPYQTLGHACDQQAAPTSVEEFLQPITFILAPGNYVEFGGVTMPDRFHITVKGDNCAITTTAAIMWPINPQSWDDWGLSTDDDIPTLRFVRSPSTALDRYPAPATSHPAGFRMTGRIQALNGNKGSGFDMPSRHVLELNGILRDGLKVFNDPAKTGVLTDCTLTMTLILKDSRTVGNPVMSWVCGEADHAATWFEPNTVEVYAYHSHVALRGICRIMRMEDCQYTANRKIDHDGNAYSYGCIDGSLTDIRGAVVRNSELTADSFFGVDPTAVAPTHIVVNAVVFDRSSLLSMAETCPFLDLSFSGFTLNADGAFGRGWWNGEYEYNSAHDVVTIPCKSSLVGFPAVDPVDSAGWRLLVHTYEQAPNWLILGAPLGTILFLNIQLEGGTYIMDGSYTFANEYVSIIGFGDGPVATMDVTTIARAQTTIFVFEGVELGWAADYGCLQCLDILKIGVVPGQACFWLRAGSDNSKFKKISFTRAAGTPYAVVIDPHGPGFNSSFFEDCCTELGGFLIFGEAVGTYKNCACADYGYGATNVADAGARFSGLAEGCTGGDYCFGAASEGGDARCGGLIKDCHVGGYSYGSTNNLMGVGSVGVALCNATLVDCSCYGNCLGYSWYDDAEFSGRMERCSFGSYGAGVTNDATAVGSFTGYAVDCRVPSIIVVAHRFGSNVGDSSEAVFSGTAIRCDGGYLSFGALGAMTGSASFCNTMGGSFGGPVGNIGKTLVYCSVFGIEDTDFLPPTLVRESKIIGCGFFVKDGEVVSALWLDNSGQSQIEACSFYTLDGDASISIDPSLGVVGNVRLLRSSMNKGIDVAVTNLIAVPYNVVDANYLPLK